MGKTTRKNGTGKRKKSPAPVVPTAEAINAASQAVEVTALAWSFAISARVKELAEELGRIDYVRQHPDTAGAAVVLGGVLDMDAVGRLTTAIDEAESVLEDLLTSKASAVPNLARACREAAVKLGLSEGKS